MTDTVYEFEWLDPEELHLVGAAANGFGPLVAKAASMVAEAADDTLSEDRAVKYVSAEARRRYAAEGVAMPNGDFPIPDEGHLRSAIGRLAQYKGNKAAAKRHIIERARKLGLTRLLPDDWHVAKSVPAQSEGERRVMSDGSMDCEQTDEMHPDAGPRHVDTAHDAGVPHRSMDAGSDLEEGDGCGDTAPDKHLPRRQALRQTRRLRKAESDGAGAEAPEEVDMEGDTAGSGDDRHAEDEADSQTHRLERDRRSGMTAAEREAQDYATAKADAASTPGSPAWEEHDAELMRRAAQLIERALHLVREGEAREKAEKATPPNHHTLKELDAMTPDELITLLDERDAARRAAKAKKAKKARKAKKAEKAAKAAKSGDAAQSAGFDAADVAKSITNTLTSSLEAAVKGALTPIEQRLATVEATPLPGGPALNAAGVAAGAAAPVLRGQDGSTGPDQAFKSLEERFAKATDPEEKARLGRELTTARLVAAERLRHGARA